MEQQKRPIISKPILWTLIVVLIIGVGFLVWYFLAGPGNSITPSTTPIVTKTTNPSSSTELTTINLYTSSLCKYAFEIPKGYIVFKKGEGEGRPTEILKIGKLEKENLYTDTGITIIASVNRIDLSLNEWVNEWLKSNQPIKDFGKSKIGNVNFQKFETSSIGEAGNTYLFLNGKYIFDISIPEGGEHWKGLVEQILSTFQFTQ